MARLNKTSAPKRGKRRFAVVNRRGDLQNCLKHQIANWSQKEQFRAASRAQAKQLLRAPIRNRRFSPEQQNRRAASRRRSKAKLRATIQTGSARNQNNFAPPDAPKRNRRPARPHATADSRRKFLPHLFARAEKRRFAAVSRRGTLR